MLKRKYMVASVVVTVAAGLVLWGCSKKDQTPATDSNIAATVNAANAGEIQTAQLAQMKASNQEVKDYATRMVNEHTATQQRQAALFARLGITPTENPTSRQLQDDTRDRLEMLRKQSGPVFDLAFIDGQLELHRAVLRRLDSDLIPGAQRDEVRTDLRQMRTDITMHLRAAADLRAKLGITLDGGTGDAGTDGGTGGDGGQTADGGGTTDGGSTVDAATVRR